MRTLPPMTSYPQEIKIAAKLLWLRRLSAKEIAEQLNLNNARVVYQWAEKGQWEALLQHETVEQATARRLIALAEKPNKSAEDYKEIEKLGNLLDKLAGIDLKKARTAREKAAGSRGESGGKSKKRKPKNDISEITPEQLEEIRKELFFEYQHRWHANKNQRTRFILKSRQIGATYYFAWEAFEDAIVSGDNQVFLSASRSQAEIFKAYILRFASQYFGIELKGADFIALSNGAELRFVSTNGRTAMGYHGHLYVDEVFWIPDFERLNKLASGMASQKKWRKTYFSTPSVKSHGAYPMWSGERYNERRKTKVEFELSREALNRGLLGPDKIWRNMVTLEDAAEQGCDLFDIDELRNEYSEAEFNNLFMCAFLEAGLSVFNLNDLLAAAVDTNVIWVDFHAKQKRPYGNHPVWIGYDPSRSGDGAAIVVVAPPLKEGDKFRVLEKIVLRNRAWQYQANRIRELTEKYNVQFIGIDCTGPGHGVFEMVQNFFPRATPIHYGLETKTALVLKTQDVVESQRIQWDAEHTDIPQAFLQIHQTTTGKDQITYAANRTSTTGHADVAWAVMHALSNEPLNRNRRKSTWAFAA
ncbi:terminase large subunit domain-containing protein [Microbulbifer spongiae]|uniref:Terminase family protein n=1 Tax=Microbulbifer spongiae TaxID=2944933 RepID=A0ABY9EA98_9GAMM|nr:terminase family protein [Microbulbifer sp. MI-G]WKD48349.1 terminase family protein [Microbulbifer sp. MI-G]